MEKQKVLDWIKVNKTKIVIGASAILGAAAGVVGTLWFLSEEEDSEVVQQTEQEETEASQL